jgi:hypothetical protein
MIDLTFIEILGFILGLLIGQFLGYLIVIALKNKNK